MDLPLARVPPALDGAHGQSQMAVSLTAFAALAALAPTMELDTASWRTRSGVDPAGDEGRIAHEAAPIGELSELRLQGFHQAGQSNNLRPCLRPFGLPVTEKRSSPNSFSIRSATSWMPIRHRARAADSTSPSLDDESMRISLATFAKSMSVCNGYLLQRRHPR